MVPTLDCEFNTLQVVTDLLTTVPCSIQLKAPENVDRVNNHFVLLLDTSESMNDNHKLDNCKRCISLLLDFMTENDCLSLITFGTNAVIHLKGSLMTETQKITVRDIINGLQTNGNTNLSAGLACVEEVCRDTINNPNLPQKTGLLLLTDGHANTGNCNPTVLRGMINTICERYTNLSVYCIAYGESHNADLLQSIATDRQGVYNIVNSIEDAAFAFGETLGGLMSCAFQNVYIKAPLGTVVHGYYKIKTNAEHVEITIGDIYAGTKPLVLLDIPSTALQNESVVKICGCQMTNLTSFEYTPIVSLLVDRNQDIELTRLRYKCTEILKQIRDCTNIHSDERQNIIEMINTLQSQLEDPFLANHPVQRLLEREINTLRSLVNEIRIRPIETHVIASQHLTSIGLSRGFSTPHHSTNRHRTIHRQNAIQIQTQDFSDLNDEEEENPQTPSLERVQDSDDEDMNMTFQSRIQSQVASVMRTRSQQ